MNTPTAQVKNLGTILGFWAHPDDESWCMGGVMAMAAQNGQRVVCVTATKGDAGQTADESRWPQSQLAKIREIELKKALQVLGVNEHIWLDYADGLLAQSDHNRATNQLAEIIDQVNPDSIFSFGPDGLTGHEDHRTMFRWTKQAIRSTKTNATFYHTVEITERYETIGKHTDKKFNIYFNIDKPKTVHSSKADLYLKLPREILARKIESLRVQECQTAAMFSDPLGQKFVQETCDCEAFMKVTL